MYEYSSKYYSLLEDVARLKPRCNRSKSAVFLLIKMAYKNGEITSYERDELTDKVLTRK